MSLSEKFRRQLRQESEKWCKEGLIDASLYEKLAELYQFTELESAARNRFIAILMGLGGVLMGLGAITFAAAHWEAWPRMYRVFLLLSLFLGVNATGFYLWRQPTLPQGYRSLGQGFLLLGALILGANMALISQIFHPTVNLYELFVIWGLAVLAMSFSLRLTALGILAIVAIEMGYWLWLLSGGSRGDFSWIQLMLQHQSLASGMLFIPLALWCRSRVIFGWAAIAVSSSLVASILQFQGWMLEFAFVLPPALLWGYNEGGVRFKITGKKNTDSSLQQSFQSISRGLAVIFLALLFYILSFNRWAYIARLDLNWEQWQRNLPLFFDVGLLSAIAFLGWMQFRHHYKNGWIFQERSMNTVTLLGLLMVTGGVTFYHLSLSPIPLTIAIVFNVMLFFLAISLIRDGFALGIRRTFWGGMILLVLGIVSRMLEYQTGLLLKSLVFVLCGIGVIAAGLWFERNVKKYRNLSVTKN